MSVNFKDIIKRFDDAQREANEANLQRYEQLLGTLRSLGEQTHGTYSEAMQGLETSGQTAREQVRRDTTMRQGQAEQDLISRGLGNTTIRSSAMRGIGHDASMQQQAINESVNQQRSSLLQGRAGNEMQIGSLMANAIQGRNDVGPDMSLYAQLLQAAAAQGDGKPINVGVGRGLPPGSLADSLRGGTGGGGGGGGAGGVVMPGGPTGGGGGTGLGARTITRQSEGLGDPAKQNFDPLVSMAQRNQPAPQQAAAQPAENEWLKRLTSFRFV